MTDDAARLKEIESEWIGDGGCDLSHSLEKPTLKREAKAHHAAIKEAIAIARRQMGRAEKAEADAKRLFLYWQGEVVGEAERRKKAEADSARLAKRLDAHHEGDLESHNEPGKCLICGEALSPPPPPKEPCPVLLTLSNTPAWMLLGAFQHALKHGCADTLTSPPKEPVCNHRREDCTGWQYRGGTDCCPKCLHSPAEPPAPRGGAK